MNLSSGATFTSEGITLLGETDGGTGIVTVFDADSTWHVNGDLNVGERSVGKIEVKSKGKVSATGASVFLGTQSNGDGSILVDGEDSTFDFDGDLFLGYRNKGKIEVNSGATFNAAMATLGSLENSSGELSVSGKDSMPSTFKTTGDLTIGKAGKGTLTIGDSGTVITQGDAIVADESTSGTLQDPSSVAISTLLTSQGDDRSLWKVDGNLTIAKHAAGEVLVSGARLEANGAKLTIGEFAGSDGTLSLFSGALSITSEETLLKVAGLMHVGERGKGTFSMVGNSKPGGLGGRQNRAIVQSLSIGVQSGGEGIVEVSGTNSLLDSTEEIEVGGEGKGNLDVKSGGRVSSKTQISIDSASQNQATALVTGSGGNTKSILTAPTIVVGESGYGQLTVESTGEIGESGDPIFLRLSQDSGSHGKLIVQSDGEAHLKDLEIGQGSSAEIEVKSNGKIDVSGSATLGSISEAGTTTVTIDGGMLVGSDISALSKSTTTVSNSGKLWLKPAGSLRMSGTNANPATLNIQSAAELTGQDGVTGVHLFAGAAGKAVVNVTAGGKVQLDQIVVGRLGAGANQSQMTVSGNASLVKSNSLLVHNQATLTVVGGGQVDVANAVEVNGLVDVRGGTMRIGDPSAGPAAPLGAVTVYPNGRLGGSGSIKGNLFANNPFPNLEGVYKPLVALGSSPGLLVVEGDAALGAGTVLEMEIGGKSPGTQYDQLLATGSIMVNGFLDLKIVNSGVGFQLPSLGQQYTLLGAAGGVTAAFENAASLRSVAGGSLVGWSLGLNGNFAVLEAISITPLTAGDYNGDGAVNASDYVVWRHTFGGINLAADGNRDGVVDNLDYNVWRSNFGLASASGFAASALNEHSGAVPEPAPICIVLGLAVACGRWRTPRRNMIRQ